MTQDKNMNEIKIRKPNAFLYYTIGYAVKMLSKLLFRLKIDNKGVKKLKGPFLVIGNHSSVADIAFNVSAMLPKRMNVVTGKDLFSWKLFKPFIERVGCIPKDQFGLDIMSLKLMKAAVEQGRNVALYPEGKTSLDGKALHFIPPSIGKFVKFLNVDVVLSYTLGSYLTKPRYFKGFRYGKVKVIQKLLITKEELQEMTNDQVYKKLVDALQFNDNIYQQENKIRFKSKRPALGMNYILYKCPKCSVEYKMKSTDRHLICEHCGNTVEYTEYGEFIPSERSKAFSRIDLWYDFQKEAIKEEIKKDDFYIDNEVDFYLNIDREYKLVGKGQLYIDKEKIGFNGTKDGQPYEISTPLKVLHTITTKNKEGIDLVFPDGIHRFMFKNKKGSTKYGLIVEQMYRLNHSLDK